MRSEEQIKAINTALDQIGEALRGQGLTLAELIESGREIRGQLLAEAYGIPPTDTEDTCSGNNQ